MKRDERGGQVRVLLLKRTRSNESSNPTGSARELQPWQWGSALRVTPQGMGDVTDGRGLQTTWCVHGAHGFQPR
jgi:hypothetical protein